MVGRVAARKPLLLDVTPPHPMLNMSRWRYNFRLFKGPNGNCSLVGKEAMRDHFFGPYIGARLLRKLHPRSIQRAALLLLTVALAIVLTSCGTTAPGATGPSGK